MQPTLRKNNTWMANIRITAVIGKQHVVAALMDSGTIPTSRQELATLVRQYIAENGTEHVNDSKYWNEFDARDFSDAEDIAFKLMPEFWGCLPSDE